MTHLSHHHAYSEQHVYSGGKGKRLCKGHKKKAEACVLTEAEKFSFGLNFANDPFLKILLGFSSANEKCTLSCFHSLNNKKI